MNEILLPGEQEKRPYRVLRIFFIIFLLCFSTLIISSFYLPYQGRAIVKSFPVNNPDYIIVFTGDYGRIEEALKLSKEFPNVLLLISGVNPSLSLKDLAQSNTTIDQEDPNINIDYAKNTLENVLFSLNEVKNHPQVQNILIISSEYHLPRIHMLFDFFNHKNYQFTFKSVDSKPSFKKLFLERLKFIRSYFILVFWNKSR